MYASHYTYAPACMHPPIPTLIHTFFTCCSCVPTFFHMSWPSLMCPSPHRCLMTIIHVSQLSCMFPGHICIHLGLSLFPCPHTALIHTLHILALSCVPVFVHASLPLFMCSFTCHSHTLATVHVFRPSYKCHNYHIRVPAIVQVLFP